eukprot:SAG31_NODE_574_length_13967_cov_7.512042_10_plen_170_part_00
MSPPPRNFCPNPNHSKSLFTAGIRAGPPPDLFFFLKKLLAAPPPPATEVEAPQEFIGDYRLLLPLLVCAAMWAFLTIAFTAITSIGETLGHGSMCAAIWAQHVQLLHQNNVLAACGRVMPPSRNSVDAEIPAWSNGKHPMTGTIQPYNCRCTNGTSECNNGQSCFWCGA